jgi:hypothetical protein
LLHRRSRQLLDLGKRAFAIWRMSMVAEIGEPVLRECLSQRAMNRQAAKSGIKDADVKM